MTVADLMNRLSKLPGDLKVVVYNGDDYTDTEVSRVDVGYYYTRDMNGGTFTNKDNFKIFGIKEKANAVRIL